MSSRPLEKTFGPITVSAALPVGNIGNAVCELGGSRGAILECTAAVSSPAGTIEIQLHAGGDWFQWGCFQRTSGAYAWRNPGDTITLADNDLLFVNAPVYAVRFNHASGTSAAVYWRTCDEIQEMLAAAGASKEKFAVIDNATSGDNTIVAAVTDRRIRVMSGVLISAGTVTVRFESGASGTALTGQLNLVANVGFVMPHTPYGHFQTAAGSLLNLELSGAVSVDGWLKYEEAL